MTKTTASALQKKHEKERKEIKNFIEFFKEILGLQNILFNVKFLTTKEVAEEAYGIGVAADRVLGRSSAGRPGYTGIVRGTAEIVIVEENHEDFDGILHTLIHEILHTKLWWCATIESGEDSIKETLLEETINKLSDLCMELWYEKRSKKPKM